MNTQTFQDAIRSAGLQPPDYIEPGKFHKFPGEGKRNGNECGQVHRVLYVLRPESGVNHA